MNEILFNVCLFSNYKSLKNILLLNKNIRKLIFSYPFNSKNIDKNQIINQNIIHVINTKLYFLKKNDSKMILPLAKELKKNLKRKNLELQKKIKD